MRIRTASVAAVTLGATVFAVTAGGSASASSIKGVGAAGTRCTAADVDIRIQPSNHDASNGGPATGLVRVRNTSGSDCTLDGFPGFKAVEGAQSVTAHHAGSAGSTITLLPGAEADSSLTYSNVNFRPGSGGSKLCAVNTDTVQIVLPGEKRAVNAKVMEGGIDNGRLILCGQPNVSAFALGGK
ncbi:DUF4232 domain-containing protein [Streptomyces sp. SID1034]|uniref:DUF4232 domain-containing protein n=1 Tax=Streptomyces TaxID=1883 RepID=UPI00136E7BE0|nr:DUF4232 domain-containing protein [Streptomyces sp. SID1034]MYV93617.1 DUF4232 domain-containing protein [Streptomyces sp. SID1034]